MTRSLAEINRRIDVEDAVVRMFAATDERDWAALAECFTDPFVLDMTSIRGGEPATMAPREVAAAWAKSFEPLDHVHHQIGNLRTTLNGDAARLRCHGIALHHRARATGGRSRTFVGTYEFDLVEADGEWRIRRFVYRLEFIDGNLELEKPS